MNPNKKNKKDVTLNLEVPALARGTRPANDTVDTDAHLAALLVRIAGGDKQAVGTIAREYGAMLLREAERVIRGRDGAEDVVQDAYVVLLESPPVCPIIGPREWLLTMMRAIARERYDG